jgi:HAD superfamily hydrolase (TIGR01509 family)
MLDAVVFDAGGTLVRLDYEWISAMLAELGVMATVEILRRAEIQGRLLYDAAAALQPVPEGRPDTHGGAPAAIQAYWGGMLEAAGCPRERLGVALGRMDARQQSNHFLWARPMEGARDALDALAGMGLRLGCVSNSDGRAEAHLERYGLREGLEFVVDSAVVGIEKPDPRIFELALARLGVLPARALYVGDLLSVDERGSRAAGMAFVLLDPWGTYARRETGSVTGIEHLPAFIAEHFTTPSERTHRRD